MARSRTRLKDIALATGFSANTVSLALRASPRIPKETRDRILEAAERLNYLPNHVAQSLVSRETKTIGVVLTDIMNPTLTRAARSIERRFSERGYSILLAASDNILAKETKALDVFRSRQVDGMLIYPTHHRELEPIRRLREAGYPIVLLSSPSDPAVDSVAADDRGGANAAVSHLLSLGRRRIGLIGDPEHPANGEKFQGYAEALAAYGLAVDPQRLVDPHGFQVAEGYRAAGLLFERPDRPDALFTATDYLAIGAMRWLKENGLRVPEDVPVVGCDDVDVSDFIDVPLTTIGYPAEAISEGAVSRLLELIEADDDLPAPTATEVERELIIRQSSGETQTRPRRSPPKRAAARLRGGAQPD